MLRVALTAGRRAAPRAVAATRTTGGRWGRAANVGPVRVRGFSGQTPPDLSQFKRPILVFSVFGVGLLEVGYFVSTLYDSQANHKALEQSDEQHKQLHPTRNNLRKTAQNEFDDCLKVERSHDVRELYKPFDDGDALTQALRATLLAQTISLDPGVLVVTAAKGAGKTTRARHVCRELAEKKKIRGAVFVDFADNHTKEGPAEVDVLAKFWGKFSAHRQQYDLNIYDVMSSAEDTNDLTVFILDNVDFPNNQDDVVALCRELAMASAQPQGKNKKFLVLATCRDPDTATRILGINSGEKVRALAYGKNLVHGNRTMPKTSWISRGLKWSREDCARLVASHEAAWKVQLPEVARKSLLDLAERAGTPGFIRNVFTRASADGMLKADDPALSHYLTDKFSKKVKETEEEWDVLAMLQEPVNYHERAGEG